MRLNFFAIYDSAVESYMRPMVLQTDGQALRLFADEAVRADSEIAKHPEDYSIFRLGHFDDETGRIVAIEPKCIGRAHELAAVSRLPAEKQQELSLAAGIAERELPIAKIGE